MKKSLLITLLAGALCAGAQNRIAPSTIHRGTAVSTSAERISDPVAVKSTEIPSAVISQHQTARRAANNGNHTQALCESALGQAGNQFGSGFGAKTNLWYNRDVNTLTFVHRASPPNTTSPYTIGFIQYDYSTDGGATWTNNQSFLYRDTTWNVTAQTQTQRGRYPQGGLYNPPGNTDPANCFVTAYGPITDGGTTINSGWPYHYEGTQQLGGTTNNQQLFNADVATGGLGALIPLGGIIVKNTGDTWWSCRGWDGVGYDGTVVLSHGVFNSTTNDFDYTFKKVPVPVCTNVDGGLMFYQSSVIFNDAGNIGYLVVSGNDWVCNYEPQDSAMGLIVLKTTDGGNTWNKVHSPDCNMVDPFLLNGGFAYQTINQLDLGMDRDDHLHIVLPIVPFQPANGIFLGYTYGSWGLFDVSTSNDMDWTACLIAKPETFFGQFGTVGNTTTDPEVDEDSRVQFSRNWDGSKIFYTWFDTDTTIFGPGFNNFPDAHCMGRDLDGDLWTAEVNFTEFSGTSADGSALFGNVSYYTINDGTNENVPFVTNTLASQPTGTGVPVNFFYEGCGAMSNYVNTGNCMSITGSIGLPKTPAPGAFSVSSNYPNPYTGKTSVDVSLVKVSDVTVEISNAIGQVLSTATYKNLHSGVNTLTLDGSSLSKGLYYYTVKAGNESSTKTMSVE